jgi:hypothetical protein
MQFNTGNGYANFNMGLDFSQISIVNNNAERSFSYYSSLNSPIVFNNNIKSLVNTFYQCFNFNQPIDIPNNVTNMAYTFFRCYNFNQSINIPNSVVDMKETFSQCSNLNKPVQLSKNVTTMHDTFYECTNFNQPINIPSNVYNTLFTFYNCYSLNQNVDINCYYINNSMFRNCTNLQRVYIENKTLSIGNLSFYNCTNAKISVPNSIATINTNAFYNVPIVCYNGNASGNPWGALNVAPHDFIAGTGGQQVAATCEDYGYNILGHCNRCDMDIKEWTDAPLGHNYINQGIVIEPNCISQGQIHSICSRCDDIQIEYIPALGHNYDNGTVIVQPDCNNTGIMQYTCLRCNKIKNETIDALGHNYVDGICTRCGDTINYEPLFTFSQYNNTHVIVTGINYDLWNSTLGENSEIFVPSTLNNYQTISILSN